MSNCAYHAWAEHCCIDVALICANHIKAGRSDYARICMSLSIRTFQLVLYASYKVSVSVAVMLLSVVV